MTSSTSAQKRCFFYENVRDRAAKAETIVTKVEEQVEEAYTLIEDIDNVMKDFKRQ